MNPSKTRLLFTLSLLDSTSYQSSPSATIFAFLVWLTSEQLFVIIYVGFSLLLLFIMSVPLSSNMYLRKWGRIFIFLVRTPTSLFFCKKIATFYLRKQLLVSVLQKFLPVISLKTSFIFPIMLDIRT